MPSPQRPKKAPFSNDLGALPQMLLMMAGASTMKL
jgi:hypothetical protein